MRKKSHRQAPAPTRANSTWGGEARRGISEAKLTQREDGRYRLEIVADGLRLVRRGGDIYWLIDMDSQLPIVVDFDGVKLQPRMVLKIFKKLSKQQAIRREVRRRFPILLSEHPSII